MEDTQHILVVDDETDILELIAYNLRREKFDVSTVETGEDAIRFIAETPPALVVLDLMLPGLDGLSVCRKLKQEKRSADIPILMLTAKSEDADVVKGLELGADDYLTKPFSPRVLVARIRAILRRRSETGAQPAGTSVSVGEIHIDRARRHVRCGKHDLQLSATEFDILWFLALNPGWVYARTQIIDAVRGADYAVTERSVDVQILGLRRKLGEHGAMIETVRGVGYRLNGS
ncbi:MAG: DNA-binding response regulator [Spirochaetaceae bacterium]|nr:MAG: DNA-binding response regulator [Spirochaetaceae bacterium]